MKEITAKSYTLRTESGSWLGQIVLTSDGGFFSITDYGNFNYAWRNFGDRDFREFLTEINISYFVTKISGSNAYVYGTSRKIDRAADRYAENIFPMLQRVLKQELEDEHKTLKES